MYRVLIENLAAHAHAGVTEEEKRRGHSVVADVNLEVEGEAHRTDRIGDTAEYSEVARIVAERIENTTLDTLERLAMLACEDLIANLPSVQKATVRLAKVDPVLPYPASRAGVEVSLER